MEKEKVEIVRYKDCIGKLPEGRKRHKCDILKNYSV
jgi:hypothetical protein